ncbi:MFS transporter [Patescibacteria group bacterium]|nr:MFS transporter [Patescibacteria group bacterium]
MIKVLKSFFATKLTYQVRELYISASMISLAVSMVAIFEPIYLYKNGISIQNILLFYLGIYAVYLFAVPLGAKFARRFGYEKAILLSTPFLALYYLSLYFVPSNYIFIPIAILAFVLQKSFYWPGYHADFARFGRESERGREVSNIMAIINGVNIIGPFVGGLLISMFGFKVLFVVATAIILASNIALLSTPEKFKPNPFSYKGAFNRLFAKENRRNFFGYIGFGEELIGMVIWPIFIFTLITNFLSIGSLVALSTLTTTVILLFVGRMVDGAEEQRRSVLKVGSVFKSFVWFIRMLVKGPLGVFLGDALSRITNNVIIIPMLAMTYDHANDTSVMKTVVFFEMALIVGKIIAIVLSLAIVLFLSDSFTALFLIAAFMTLLYSLIKFEPVKVKE